MAAGKERFPVNLPPRVPGGSEAEPYWKNLGNLDGLQLFNNQVLIAVYVRPEKSKKGIIYAETTKKEDEYQSKVGLVIKMGPTAFLGGDEWFKDVSVKVGDWVVFRPSDGWGVKVNGVMCRWLIDTTVRGKDNIPDRIY